MSVPHAVLQLHLFAVREERLGVPDHKVIVNIQKYGNTSAASIPIALDEAVRAGRVKTGDLVLLCAFGGGLTWASCLIRW